MFQAMANLPEGNGRAVQGQSAVTNQRGTLMIAAMDQTLFDGAALTDVLKMSAFILSSINIGISATNKLRLSTNRTGFQLPRDLWIS